ncbi:MAG: hypothetical protein R3F17_16360 [Planctomycetota bacterium]
MGRTARDRAHRGPRRRKPEVTPVAAFFDHEEAGSESCTGAQGSLLRDTVERIVAARGGDQGTSCRPSRVVSACRRTWPTRRTRTTLRNMIPNTPFI